MSAAPLPLPVSHAEHELLGPLARLRARCRLYVVLGASLQLALAVVAVSAVQLVLDRWLRFTVDQRAFINGAATIFWLWVIHRHFVLPLARPLPNDVLARWIDTRHPDLRENIAVAVQLAETRGGDATVNSPQLVDAVLREACAAARRISFLGVLDHRQAALRGAALLGLCLAVVAAFEVPLVRDVMTTWFARNWLLEEVPWPQRTYIIPVQPEGIESGRKRLPRGDELEIVARIEGEPSDTANLVWWTDAGRRGEAPMTRRGSQRWEVSLGPLNETIRFRIVGGDERTREYVIEAVERPQLNRIKARITPPEYTGLAPVTLEQQTVLEVLRGAQVEIEAWSSKPLAAALFVGGDGLATPCDLLAADHLVTRLVAVSREVPLPDRSPASAPATPTPADPLAVGLTTGSYRFELRDRDGLTDRQPIRFTVKVVPDRPPTIELKTSGVGELVTPIAELPLEVHAHDAYGLRSVTLGLQRGEAEPRILPLPGAEAPEREYRRSVPVMLAPLALEPGVRVRLIAEATDRDPAGPNIGRAPGIDLRVVSIEEFLTELARRETELRREFERLISEQRVYGDALDRVIGGLASTEAQVAAQQQLSALTRRQNAQAARCQNLARQFDQILAEMGVNKVSRAAEERRLSELIIQPLGELAGEIMPAAADRITALRSGRSAERLARVRDDQAEMLRRMRAILANMLEWEGYREAVALLREIIAAQSELRTDTMNAVGQQLDAILGDDPAPGSGAPPARPGGESPPK